MYEDENELLSIELTKPEHITVEMGLIYQPKDIVVKAIYTNEEKVIKQNIHKRNTMIFFIFILPFLRF